MKHGAFLRFIFPSLAAMLLFIALPIGSVFIQSLHVAHEQVLVASETCGPFGCTASTTVDAAATAELREEEPLGRYVGFDTYTGRNHLAFDSVAAVWQNATSVGDLFGGLLNLRFYRALAFTLAYTLVVTPFVILLGLMIALGVNALPRLLKGPTIFVTLLPMIVTPLIGGLVLFWMIDSRGVLGATLIDIFNDPDLSLKASPALTWIMLMVYGIWHAAPLAFIVFYAGLQTVNGETLEAAIIDGANRWEQLVYVVVPHLMPLVIFIALIQLMDNFRVFEPIVAFQSAANATSLSYVIYSDLRGTDTQLFGSAAATSLLTILGIAVLVTPVVVRTWRDFNRKKA